MNKASNIAIVGATGLVGKTFLELLESDHFLDSKIHLVASSKSKGQEVFFRNSVHVVNSLEEFNFSEVDVVFFSAGDKVAKKYAPKAQKEGCFVVDNSSCFRQDESIPLIVPEVNSEDFTETSIPGIVANPNCSTIQMVVALYPLHKAATINRVVVSTYQSTSGAGAKGMSELLKQTSAWVNNEPMEVSVFPAQIAFNLFPHVDVFLKNGYTREEMKMVNETRKIMDAPEMGISATCVRVPVLRAHSEAIWIETERKLTPQEAREILEKAPGIVVKDEPVAGGYPMPWDVDETVEIYVGRIREDFSHPRGLAFWVVADQLYKGAALNSIQIAEVLAAG